MQEQTQSDRLPGDPVQLSPSQTRLNVAIHTFHVRGDGAERTDAGRRRQCLVEERVASELNY